jgi:DNA-binding transcriptional regulator YiaG
MKDETLRRKSRAFRELPGPAMRQAIRRDAGLSQVDLAQSIGVDRATVSRWETGTRRPRGDQLVAYVELLRSLTRNLSGLFFAILVMFAVSAPAKARNLIPLLEVPSHRPWTTVRWLRRQVAERRIPYYKPTGGRVLIDLADLDALAERGRVEPAP